ncbi:MAG: hypothetical protein D6785_04190, partial [Planctomycetota bacterium]
PGEYLPYQHISEIREISNWSLLELSVSILRGFGVSDRFLKEIGVTQESLQKAGLAYEYFKTKPNPLTEREKKVMKLLKEKGIPVDEIAKLGQRQLKGYLYGLAKLSDEDLEKRLNNKKWVDRQKRGVVAKRVIFSTIKQRLQERLPKAFERMAILIANIQLSNYNVEALGIDEYRRIKPFLTVYSQPFQRWTGPKLLLNTMEPRPDRWYSVARIPYTPAIPSFSVMEIQQGNQKEYRKIWRAYSIPTSTVRNGFTQLVMLPALQGIYDSGQAVVRGLSRPFININTAPKEVIKAVLIGLRLRGSKDFVGPQESENLATQIVDRQKQGGFQDFEDFYNFIMAQVSQNAVSQGYDQPQGISRADATAIILNSVNPQSYWISSGTYGFTFQSSSIYTLEAQAVINDLTGKPKNFYGERGTYLVAPPGKLYQFWDSQMDFTSSFIFGGKNLEFLDRTITHLATFPFSPYVQSAQGIIFPDKTFGAGEIRLERIRLPESGYYTEHADLGKEWLWEGKRIQKTLFIPTLALAGGAGGLPSTLVKITDPQTNVARSYPVLSPGRMELWIKPEGGLGGGMHTLFDMGEGEYLSRVTLQYDGSRQELVFRIADDTLDSKAVAVRSKVSLLPNVWYHICAYWKSSNPWDMALFLDGKKIGQADFVTTLTSPLDQDQFLVNVKSTLGFPSSGVLKIGNEVVEYSAKQGNRFILKTKWVPTGQVDKQGKLIMKKVRAFRFGNQAHLKGTLVTLYGYALPIPANMIVGKSSLALPLKTPTPILYLELKSPKKMPTPLQPTDTTIKVLKEYKINFNKTFQLPNGSSRPLKYKVADFPPEGYIRVRGTTLSGNNEEIMFYTSLAGATFSGLARGQEGTSPETFTRLSSIELISIKVTNTQDYPQSGKIQIYRSYQDSEWITYQKSQSRPLFLIIGQRDYGPGSNYIYSQKTHTPGALVMPVYNAWRSGVMGTGDVVTLYDKTQSSSALKRARMVINRAKGLEFAFTSHLPRPFAPFFPYFGLILKWPSGLLPLEVQENMAIGGRGAPTLSGKIPVAEVFPGYYDEIQFQRVGDAGQNLSFIGNGGRNFGRPVILSSINWIKSTDKIIMLPSRGTKAQLDAMKIALASMNPKTVNYKRLQRQIRQLERRFQQRKNNWKSFVYWFMDPDPRYYQYGGYNDSLTASFRIQEMSKLRAGGLILMGNEVISIGSIDFKNNLLVADIRGALGTKAEEHGPCPFLVLEWPLNGILKQVSSQRMDVWGSPGFQGTLPLSGYFMSLRGNGQRTIAAYKMVRMRKNNKLTRFFLTPYYDQYGQPLFQNCFGTIGAGLAPGDRVIFMPWRYKDLYEPGRDGYDIAHYEVRFRPGKAYFERLIWEGTVTPGTQIIVQARIDGEPAWTAKPNTPINGKILYEFRDPKQATICEEGHEIQIRVYFTFKKGAFLNNLWKETPVLKRLGIEYRQNTRKLYGEILPK